LPAISRRAQTTAKPVLAAPASSTGFGGLVTAREFGINRVRTNLAVRFRFIKAAPQ